MALEPGDVVEVVKNGVTYRGTVLPRTEEIPDNVLMIKLKNGYNIGIKITPETEIRILEKGEPPKKYSAPIKVEHNPELPTAALVATGGTIASRVDYKTGGVVAEFTAEDFLLSFPEIAELANLKLKQVSNIFSEDMMPDYWVRIAKGVGEMIKNGVDGVVITHGTDTMHYTAAFLSFALQNVPVPVVLVGAQRSSDRPSSDAAINLLNAINVAVNSDLAGTFIVMHETMDDAWTTIHPGTRARKMHTSRRDTFKTVGDKPVGRSLVVTKGGKIVDRKIKIWRHEFEKRGQKGFKIDAKANSNVFLLKSFPGLRKDIFEHILLNHDGVIIEGTGLGHVRQELIPVIAEATESGVFVGITPQPLFGRVHPHVYSTAVKMMEAGAVYLEDMLPETALVKLMWALGHSKDREKVKEIMLTNYAGEITKRSRPDAFW
ncbi:MAG: glutamyl-tRNA(Gln) amidotransferase subunit [Candidatus Diapherotrites archaeon]|nr:glutamyl-tRNA(Gln) amidotransferase subunit [Candidatus Diapherotrites archaeon]MDN5367113.1 glutamyl-tRNA(Gln) amidotransferase subunit [Candidatus Diapherotrites archaeon]